MNRFPQENNVKLSKADVPVLTNIRMDVQDAEENYAPGMYGRMLTLLDRLIHAAEAEGDA